VCAPSYGGQVTSSGKPEILKLTYAKKPDWATLAAAYAFSLSKNHGFVDGNKRVAFMAAYVFLGLNGYDLEAGEPEVVAITVTEAALAKWFRMHLNADHPRKG
jgi:death-on-curing family protein